MGFASYLEDIEARIAENLARLSSQIPKDSSDSQKQLLTQLKRVRTESRNILKKVQELLDLATDPEVDLAQEIVQSRKNYEAAQEKIKELEAHISSLRAEVKSERSLHIETKGKLWESDKDRDILVKLYVQEQKLRKKTEQKLEQLKQKIETEQNEIFKDEIDKHIDRGSLQQKKQKLNDAWNS